MQLRDGSFYFVVFCLEGLKFSFYFILIHLNANSPTWLVASILGSAALHAGTNARAHPARMVPSSQRKAAGGSSKPHIQSHVTPVLGSPGSPAALLSPLSCLNSAVPLQRGTRIFMRTYSAKFHLSLFLSLSHLLTQFSL